MENVHIPDELPIVYTTPILIPGFHLKIKFPVENNTHLLNYLLKNIDLMIGIIPKVDSDKVNNVIGTVSKVRSVIHLDSTSKEFFLLVQGICRFKLDSIVSEEPIKINKITPIKNFLELEGDAKEKNELVKEFKKVFSDFLVFSNTKRLTQMEIEAIKTNMNRILIHNLFDICLKNILLLTPADAYKVLRAKNFNHLLLFAIDGLKRETIIEANVNPISEKTDLLPIFIEYNIGNKNKQVKKCLSPELEELQTTIKKSNMSKPVYVSIMKEFNRLKEMNAFNAEYSVLLHHLSYVANLPWNKTSNETLDLEKAKDVLKLNHYGMDKVKNRIIQFIAVRKINPKRRGPILCFVGPPGVGKTTIAKAIANSLNRNFKKISLGGINHFSDIKGHRKTYVGSMPGCIIQAVNQSRTSNPVILLDEIDKMYKGASGDPAAALLEVLDPEQNSSFVDSYVNFPFDLSQVMFISTANNVLSIPNTLRDRMEIIYLEGYTHEEKMQIAKNNLIPKILKEHEMNEIQITFCKNTISDIIQKYTSEAGVRELQRKLEAICHYIAVEVIENSHKEMKNYVITPECLPNILGSEIYGEINILVQQSCNRVGVAIGLSWTPVGGKVLVIEASRIYSRNEKSGLVLTGLAGQTLRESVEIGLNWIQSFVKKNDLNINDFCVHVHLPEGGHRKDGPSAGITILCALISLFWKIPLRSMIAMTGEISLKGYILPVGGVKEKILAAYNLGIRTIIIPELNLKHTNNLSKNIKEDLNIIPVKHVEEVLDIVFPGGLASLLNPTSDFLPRSKI